MPNPSLVAIDLFLAGINFVNGWLSHGWVTVASFCLAMVAIIAAYLAAR